VSIKGLTDRPAAFPSVGILRKGEKKVKENAPGKDLTFFRFVTDDDLAAKMFAEAYPDEEALRNINIFLPFKTTDENMDSWIEKWVASSLVYRSDGETVVLWRKERGGFSTELKPDPKPAVGEDGKRADGSSQVGRLSVIIPDLGRFATVTIMTTSKNDILNLTRQLRGYEALLGDLRGTPFVIRRRPHMISTPAQNGKRARRESYLLSIETQAQWSIQRLGMMERAALAAGNMVIDAGGEYDLEQLPASITSPFEDEVSQSGPSPAPETPKSPTPEPAPAVTPTNGDIPRTPQALLDTVNRRVEATYDSLFLIEKAIVKELGKGWTWPKSNDAAGWKAAYEAAYGHAVAKTVSAPIEATGEQQELFDGEELDDAFPRGSGAAYED